MPLKPIEVDAMLLDTRTESRVFRWHLGGAGMHLLRQRAIGFVYF